MLNVGAANAALRLVPNAPQNDGPKIPEPGASLPPGGPPVGVVPPVGPGGPHPGTTPTVGLPNGGHWAKYASKLAAGATVAGSGYIIKKGGRIPNDPDNDDLKLFEEALEEGLKLQYGMKEIPWWLGAAMAGMGIYAGMRMNAPLIEEPPPDPGNPAVEVPRGAMTPDTLEEPEPGEAPGVRDVSSVLSTPMKPHGAK